MATKRKTEKRVSSALKRYLASLKKQNPAFRKATAVRMRKGKDGSITIMPVKQNVAMGFKDASGRFHPIRSSYDYDPGRTGESISKGHGLRVPRKKARRRGSVKAKGRAKR